MKRSKSSRSWLKRHVNDEYVKRAREAGYRSRAAFKLLEIQQRDRLLKPGQRVVDIGAAPGGWAQIAADAIQPGGRLIALDLLPVEPLPGVEIIQGDFRDDAVLAELEVLLGGDRLDLVISDLAPNVSGVDAIDQPRAMHLCELVLDFATDRLGPGGGLLVKVFQGQGSESYLRALRQAFDRVVVRKPRASRPKSREVYAVGTGYRGRGHLGSEL